MMWNKKSGSDCKSLGLLVLRIVLGAVFIYHGITKFQNPGMADFIGWAASSMGLNFFSAEIWFNIVKYTEVIGGAMLILGLWTWLATVLLLAVMAVAINVKGWSIQKSELEMVLAGSLIALMLSGAGKYALMTKKHMHMGCGCSGGNCNCGSSCACRNASWSCKCSVWNCSCKSDCSCHKTTETVVVTPFESKEKPEIMEV